MHIAHDILNEVLERRHQQLDHRLRNLEIEQGIAHIHVEQSPFPLRDAADFLFAADFAAVFAELFGGDIRVVVLALAQVVSALALNALGQGIDMHYARALDVHDEVHIRGLAQRILRCLFRLLERDAVQDVLHADKAQVAHPALGFLAQHVHIVADEVGQALVDEEAPRKPLAADARDDGVLPVCLHHCGEDERELKGRRDARLHRFGVVGYEGIFAVRSAFARRELLVGEDAVAGGKVIADIVARAGIPHAGRERPALQFSCGEVEQLVELLGAPHERGKTARVLLAVALVEGEKLHGEAFRGDGHALLVQHFQDDFSVHAPVEGDEVERREFDIGVEFCRGAAGETNPRDLGGQQEFRLGGNPYRDVFPVLVREVFDVKPLDGRYVACEMEVADYFRATCRDFGETVFDDFLLCHNSSSHDYNIAKEIKQDLRPRPQAKNGAQTTTKDVYMSFYGF